MSATPMITRTPRLPALARVAAFWIAYMAILFLASMPKSMGMVPASIGQLQWGLTSSAALLALTVFVLKREHRSPADIGLAYARASAPRFLLGTCIGVATYGLAVLAIAVVVGGLRLVAVPTPDAKAIVLGFVTTFTLASMEELGFRGYPLRTLVPRIGLWPAQVIVAVAFAATHIAFGWSWSSVLFGVLPSAFLFGAAAIASGGLAMPIGVHVGVNAARQAFGESHGGWFWNIAADDASIARISQVAPVTGIAITTFMTLVLWRWHSRQHSSAPSREAILTE
jgi:membrane protease YdiL (CAAX protease family)